MLAHQKSVSDKSGVGYTGGSSSLANITNEVRFMKAKEPIVEESIPDKVKIEKKKNMVDQQMFNTGSKNCTEEVGKKREGVRGKGGSLGNGRGKDGKGGSGGKGSDENGGRGGKGNGGSGGNGGNGN
nr:cold shock domain-containing protein 4-like [Quercus suber]